MSALKDIRIARGYKTAKAFASEIHIAYGTYIHYEADPYSMSASRLIDVSKALRVTTDEILGLSDFKTNELIREVDISKDLKRMRDYLDDYRHCVAKLERNVDVLTTQWNTAMKHIREKKEELQ